MDFWDFVDAFTGNYNPNKKTAPTPSYSPSARPSPTVSAKVMNDLRARTGNPTLDAYYNNPSHVPYGGQTGSSNYMAQLTGQLPGSESPAETLRQNLLKQLLAGLNAGKPKVQSVEQIKKEAAEMIGLQFNPQIKTLKQLMQDARSDAGVNSKEIKALYADLAGSYEDDAAFAKREIDAAKSEESKALGALQGRVNTQYDGQMADQQADFAKLGILDALPAATQGQTDDRSFLQNLNATESGAQQRMLSGMGQTEMDYYQRGAGIARKRGVESVENLIGTLDQYLREQGGSLAAIQGQKGSAIAQLVSTMQQANNQAYGSWDSDRWSRMAQVLGLVQSGEQQDFSQQMQMMKLQQQMMQGQKPGNQATKGIEGAYNTLNGLLGNNSGNAISALQNFLQTTTQREGWFEGENDNARDMTPQQAASEARKYGSQMNLSPAEVDALVQAVYAYYGKLR